MNPEIKFVVVQHFKGGIYQVHAYDDKYVYYAKNNEMFFKRDFDEFVSRDARNKISGNRLDYVGICHALVEFNFDKQKYVDVTDNKRSALTNHALAIKIYENVEHID